MAPPIKRTTRPNLQEIFPAQTPPSVPAQESADQPLATKVNPSELDNKLADAAMKRLKRQAIGLTGGEMKGLFKEKEIQPLSNKEANQNLKTNSQLGSRTYTSISEFLKQNVGQEKRRIPTNRWDSPRCSNKN